MPDDKPTREQRKKELHEKYRETGRKIELTAHYMHLTGQQELPDRFGWDELIDAILGYEYPPATK